MTRQGGQREPVRLRRTRRRSGGWMKLKPGCGDMLRRRRRRLDMSQRDLAFLARCSQNTISLLEQEKMTTLSEDLARIIARKVQADWEELFESRESPGVRRMATGARTARQSPSPTPKRGAA